jgi:hypothetical protein
VKAEARVGFRQVTCRQVCGGSKSGEGRLRGVLRPNLAPKSVLEEVTLHGCLEDEQEWG